jgi:hypothetical protein
MEVNITEPSTSVSVLWSDSEAGKLTERQAYRWVDWQAGMLTDRQAERWADKKPGDMA